MAHERRNSCRDQRTIFIGQCALGILFVIVFGFGETTSALGEGPRGTVPQLTPETTPPAFRVQELRGESDIPVDIVRAIARLQALGADDPNRLTARPTTAGVPLDPLAKLLADDALRQVPFVWRSFFRTALVTVGREHGQHVRAGLYSPLMDLWVITDWMRHPALLGEKTPEPDLADLWVVSGETLRDGLPRVTPAPEWVGGDHERAPFTLPRLTQATLSAFHAADQAGIAPGQRSSERGGDDYRHRLALRLLDFAGATLFLEADPLREQVRLLTQSMAQEKGDELKRALPDLDAGDAKAVADLPAGLRARFEPTSVLPLRYGGLVTFGIPEAGRWVLVGLYVDDAPGALKLRRLVLLDLAEPVANGGAAK